jgi:hypothetical protein
MNSMTIAQQGRARSDRAPLWVGGALTAVAAVLFPRLNAVLHDNQALWEVDREAAVLIPVIVSATLALFALVAGWAWRGERTRNRPAKVGLACGILGPVGVLAFFVSAPIILGGLALTLGLEGNRRAGLEGKRRHAVAAIVLGVVAVLVGAAIWLVGA